MYSKKEKKTEWDKKLILHWHVLKRVETLKDLMHAGRVKYSETQTLHDTENGKYLITTGVPHDGSSATTRLLGHNDLPPLLRRKRNACLACARCRAENLALTFNHHVNGVAVLHE
jgi:hypothetical protein